MRLPSNLQTSTSVLICNFVKKKKKYVKFAKAVKKTVYSSMACNINLPRCKPLLNALTIIITLCKDTVSKLNVNMRFFNVSMRPKRKRLTSS